MSFVYFLKSNSHNYYYVGSTNNLEKRLAQHNRGEVRSTQYRKPYNIVYTEKFDNITEARKREKLIKKTGV